MSSKVIINGIECNEQMFAFDGCHKFYTISNSESRKEAIKLGYKIYYIEEIAKEFFNSCSLRFIQRWHDFFDYVPQCEDVVEFEINGKKIIEDFVNNTVKEM